VRVAIALGFALAAAFATLATVVFYTIAKPAEEWRSAHLEGFGDECQGWIPTKPRTDHLCTGASSRLREVQAFLKDPVYE
jgi:hypothetical protein